MISDLYLPASHAVIKMLAGRQKMPEDDSEEY
jgi:hypothetical protein